MALALLLSSTWIISGGTLTVGNDTLAVSSDTLTVDGGTLMADDDTLMSNVQHRLGSVVTSMTRSRHHTSVANIDLAAPSSARLSCIVTRPNNTLKMKI
jgi:hypothetical protein